MMHVKCLRTLINVYFHLFNLLIILFATINEVHSNKTLNLAVLSPWNGYEYGIAAIVVALEDVYTSGLLPHSYKVNWTWRNSNCENP